MQHEYFVVMLDYGRAREATVNPEQTWAGAVDAMRQACAEDQTVSFLHQIVDGRAFDRATDAAWKVSEALAATGEPITWSQWNWLRRHLNRTVADAFRLEAA